MLFAVARNATGCSPLRFLCALCVLCVSSRLCKQTLARAFEFYSIVRIVCRFSFAVCFSCAFGRFLSLLFLLKEKVTKSSRQFDAEHFLRCVLSADELPGGKSSPGVAIHRSWFQLRAVLGNGRR